MLPVTHQKSVRVTPWGRGKKQKTGRKKKKKEKGREKNKKASEQAEREDGIPPS